MDQFSQLHHMSGGSSKNQSDNLRQSKSKPDPEFLSLTRCAGCYNQNQKSSLGQGGSCESSSTSDDSSSSESESESEVESSCRDSRLDQGLLETHEKAEAEEDSPASAVAVESVAGGQDGNG